jgi:tetratricopeptide (TPR) repeat protein
MKNDERPPDIEPILDSQRAAREDKRPGWRKASSMKDVDSGYAVRNLQVYNWAIGFAVLFGMFGAVGSGLIGHSPLYGFLVAGGVTFGFVMLFGLLVPKLFSDAGSGIYAPSGSSTPAPPEYSLAQSLAVRGQFDAAMRTYEDAMQEHPDDPEPCIRIARILRDSLQRHEEAVTWFKRAREKNGITDGQEIMVSREISELYMFTLRSPTKAAPELARLAAKHPGTPAGEWAKTNLREIKEIMRQEEP